MPRPTKERIDALPVTNPVSKPQMPQVVAHPVDQTVAPAVDPELNGLLQGLSTFNPALEKYTQTKNTQDAQSAYEQGATAGRLELDPNRNVSSPITMPDKIEPAFKNNFDVGYRESVGITLGNKSRDAMLSDYAANRTKPDFNIDAWSKQWTQQEFAGITDPAMLSEMSKVHATTLKTIRADFRDRQIKELQDNGTRLQMQGLADSITEDMSPITMGQVFQNGWLPKALASGFITRSEANSALLDHLQAMSMRRGGTPEIFDAFHAEDASGMSPYRSDPGFAEKVEKAKKDAATMRDGHISDETLRTIATDRMKLEDHLRAGHWDELTDDKLMQYVGKKNVFSSDGELQAFRAHIWKARDASDTLAHATELAHQGLLGMVPDEKVQKQVIQRLVDPDVNTIISSVNQPGKDAAQARLTAMANIVGVTQTTGVATAEPRLKEFFGSIGTSIPTKDSVPPERFNAAVDAYTTLKAKAPNLIDLYFSDDSKSVLEAYATSRNAGDEPKLAYQRAYAGVTPEAKERLRQLEKDPEFNKKIDKAVSGMTTEFWRNRLPFGQTFGVYPTNEDSVSAAARLEAKKFLMQNPNLGESQAAEHVQQWVSSNYVHDKEANLIVRVPPGQATPAARDAISSFTKSIKAQQKADSVELVFDGRDSYDVNTRNPTQALSGKVPFTEIMQQHYFNKHLKPDEATRMVELRKQLIAGAATVADLDANRDLIAKARQVGAWDPLAEQRATRVRQQAAPNGNTKVLALFSGQTMANDNLDASRLPATSAKTDVAQAFLRSGDVAGALTAMGEGVALRAYPDPARGRNIGLGYNMDANKGTIREDFRRAGIPSERVEDVISGKAEISTEQAMRLYQVVKPRYESIAKTGIEKRYPGEWDKLPANQRAVLTDMAYQVGDVSQFSKGIEALVRGDMELAGSGLKVHYRSRQTGEMVADLGRHNLRLYMLNTPSMFEKLVAGIAQKPRNIIQARTGQ